MIYLQSFHMLSQKEDWDFFDVNSTTYKNKNFRTCYSSQPQFVMFSERSNTALNNVNGPDDYDRRKTASDARRKKSTQSQYLRSRLMRNAQERSNG